MKLNKFYSIDECQDDEVLYQRLQELVDEGKVEYELIDKWTLKIKDLDLSTSEEKNLVELFDSLDIHVADGDDEEEVDDDFYFGGDDELEDDYNKPSRRRSSYDEEEFGDY